MRLLLTTIVKFYFLLPLLFLFQKYLLLAKKAAGVCLFSSKLLQDNFLLHLRPKRKMLNFETPFEWVFIHSGRPRQTIALFFPIQLSSFNLIGILTMKIFCWLRTFLNSVYIRLAILQKPSFPKSPSNLNSFDPLLTRRWTGWFLVQGLMSASHAWRLETWTVSASTSKIVNFMSITWRADDVTLPSNNTCATPSVSSATTK